MTPRAVLWDLDGTLIDSELIGLGSVFQAVVSAEDVRLGKPGPQVFLTAAAPGAFWGLLK